MNNYPPGVSESTFGAPGNDQCYIVSYELHLDITNELTLSFKTFTYEISLPGPAEYTNEEIEDFAISCIEDDYERLISEYNLRIEILYIEDN